MRRRTAGGSPPPHDVVLIRLEGVIPELCGEQVCSGLVSLNFPRKLPGDDRTNRARRSGITRTSRANGDPRTSRANADEWGSDSRCPLGRGLWRDGADLSVKAYYSRSTIIYASLHYDESPHFDVV